MEENTKSALILLGIASATAGGGRDGDAAGQKGWLCADGMTYFRE